MLTVPTEDFLILAVVVAVSTAFGVYMAARPAFGRDDGLVELSTMDSGEDPMEHQLTFEDALANKEAVLAEVADRNSAWLALAAAAMRKMDVGTTGIGEDFRFMLKERGVPEPKHPNVIGAFIATMKRRGALVETGEYRPMRGAKANGRRSPVYSLQNPEAA